MMFERISKGSRVFRLGFAVTIALILSTSTKSSGQSGEDDYRHYCASCHGLDGKGKGTFEGTTHVPDITRLTEKNGGKFPFEEVYQVVDGRSQSPWHQRRADMPFWGDVFREEERPPTSKAKVKARISAVVEYVRHLQRK